MRDIRSAVVWVKVAAAILGLTATVQAGQEFPARTEKSPSAGFVIAPSVMLTDLGLDTNILAAAVDPKSDVITTLVMQAEPAGRVGPLSFRSRGAISLAYFRQYANQRSVDAEGALKLDLQRNRMTFYGSGSAGRLRDSFGPEIDTRVRRREASFEGGAELRATGKTSIAVAARRSQIAFSASEVLFDNNLRTALDRTVDTVAVVARNAITPLTTVVVGADAQHDRFPFSPLRDANGAQAFAGFEFSPTALIAGRARAGYRRFVSRDTRFPAVGGVVASVDLTYTLGDALRIGARLQRDLAHSYSFDEQYFFVTEVQLSATRRLTRSWDITAMALRRRLDYRGGISAAPHSQPTDRLFGYGGGVEYRIGSTSTVAVSAEYYRRQSELTGLNYDRLRLVSSLARRF